MANPLEGCVAGALLILLLVIAGYCFIFKILIDIYGWPTQSHDGTLTFDSSVTSAKGTLSQQDNLLRLPLPELAVTISKWLETTKPHLTENEFAKTKFLAENFVNEAEPFQVPKTF